MVRPWLLLLLGFALMGCSRLEMEPAPKKQAPEKEPTPQDQALERLRQLGATLEGNELTVAQRWTGSSKDLALLMLG